MKSVVYINGRGEHVYPFYVFRALDPAKVKPLPAKRHLSRRERRIRNGTIPR